MLKKNYSLAVYDYQGTKLCDLANENIFIKGEAYNVVLHEEINGYKELNFNIPAKIEDEEGNLIDNFRLNFIKNEYKVKLKIDDKVYDFVIKKLEKQRDSKGAVIYNVKCVCLAFDKLSKSGLDLYFEDEVGTAKELLEKVLEGSDWSVGEVDTFMQDESHEKYRTLKADRSNRYALIQEICNLFECYPVFHTDTKKVDLREEIGVDNGVQFRYSKNLREIVQRIETGEIITKLWVEGGEHPQHGLTLISSQNPTGENYLLNFKYYLDLGLLTAEQANAIIQFENNIKNINNTINTLLNDIANLDLERLLKESEKERKEIEKIVKEQTIDELNQRIAVEKDGAVKQQLINQRNSLQSQLNVLINDINNLNTAISNLDSQITTKESQLQVQRNNKNTAIRNLELAVGDFIREGIYQNTNYIDAESLYKDALKVSEKLAYPRVSYEVNVVDLSRLTGYEIEKFGLGDIVHIIDETLGIDTKGRVTIVEYVLDNPKDTRITISNFDTSFENLFQKIITATTIINAHKELYDRAKGFNPDGTIDYNALQQTFNNYIFELKWGTGNSIIPNKYGITIKDIENPNKMLRLNAGGIFTTSDGGQTWRRILSADGLAALSVDEAHIKDAAITNAKIADAVIDEAKIANAAIGTAKIQDAAITSAKIQDAAITSAKIQAAQIESAHIKQGAIQQAHIAEGAVGSLQVAKGAIGDAHISSLRADKLTSGTIDTARVTIAGPDNRLVLSGNKLQIFEQKDTQLYERIMLGVDENNNSVLTLRGADGQTILLTQDGLTEAGFTDGYNKVADDSLDPRKIDIQKVVTRINNGTTLIQGSKIQLDDKTLDVAFTNIEETLEEYGQTISNHSAQITANAQAIALKLNAQEFNEYKATNDSNISTIQSNLSTLSTEIGVLQGEIVLKANKTDIENISIGGRNLILNSDIENAHAEDEQRTATFTRNSVAYLSDGTLVDENQPRFEPGKFGKAIMMEEETTNVAWLIPNLTNLTIGESYEVNNRRFTRLDQDTYKVEYLTDVVGTGIVGITNDIVWTAGSHTISADILDYYLAPGSVGYFGIGRASFGGPHLHANDGVLGRKAYTYNDTEDRGSLRLAIRAAGSNDIIKAGSYMVFRYVQVELNKAYATSYINGTRSRETLIIPGSVLNPQEGTVEILLYVNQAIRDSSAVRRFFEHLPGPGNSNRITMQHNDRPHWLFAIGDANGNVHLLSIADSEVADGWRLFTMKWGASEFAVYVDGVKKASISNPTYLPSAVGRNIIIKGEINTLIGDLRISNRARSDEEILAAYQSGQPLPVDEYTTWKMDFENSLRPSKPLQRDLSMPLVEGQEYMLSLTSSGKVSARIYSEDDKSDYIYADNGTTTIKFVPENTGKYIVELYSGVDDTEAKVKLEKGNKATDWTPAPEDTTTAIDDATTRIEERISQITTTLDGITNQVSLITTEVGRLQEHAETLVQQTATDLTALLTQSLSDLENNLIQRYEADLQATAQGLTLTFSGVQASLDELSEDIAAFKTIFQFSAEGMEIGRAESPFKLKLTNDKMSFMDSGVEIAYFSTQKMYITEAEILNSIKVGNHLIEKYNDTITLVRWVG